MPSTINLYQIGVWAAVGFFTGAGWAFAGWLVGRIFSHIVAQGRAGSCVVSLLYMPQRMPTSLGVWCDEGRGARHWGRCVEGRPMSAVEKSRLKLGQCILGRL